jgi:hypothetical protein
MISADAGTFSVSSLSPEGKAVLKNFLSDPNAGKLWEIDVPAILDNEPVIPHNYWIRGILGELAIYKKIYKNAGYSHAPTAAGYDFTGPAWVQIKTVANPATAYQRMRKAVDKLIDESPSDKRLRLHILRKPGNTPSEVAAASELKAALDTYIQNTTAVDRFDPVIIDPFELAP